MTGDDLREALKWSLVATLIAALWCGVLAVREVRGAGQLAPLKKSRTERVVDAEAVTADTTHPVWVIVVFHTSKDRLAGVTEFVFASYR